MPPIADKTTAPRPRSTPAPDDSRGRTPSTGRKAAHGDYAHWSCACGRTFRAPVSTTVPCPRCGGVQAW